MERGKKLRLGAVASLAAVVVVGAFILSGGAGANAGFASPTDVGHTISGDTANGTVDEVYLNASGTVEWDNFDTGENATVHLEVEGPDGNTTELGSDTVQIESGDGSANFSVPESDITSNTSWNDSDFGGAADGNSTTTDLDTTLVLEDEDGEVLGTTERDVTVEVGNE